MKKFTKETKIIFIILFMISAIFMSFSWHMTSSARENYNNDIAVQSKGTITKEEEPDYYGSSELVDAVFSITRPLYLSYLQETLPADQIPSERADLLLSNPSEISKVDKDVLLGIIASEQSNYYNQFSSVSYYIVDALDDKKVFTNDEYLKSYLDKDAKGAYGDYWYISFQTLEDGRFQLIQTSSTVDVSQIQSSYTDIINNITLHQNTSLESDLLLKPIRNTKFVLAFSKGVLKEDLSIFSSDVNTEGESYGINASGNMQFYERATFMAYYVPFTILAFLIMLAMPFERMKKSKLVQIVTTKEGCIVDVFACVIFAIIMNTICPTIMHRIGNGTNASIVTGIIACIGIAVSFLPFALLTFIIKKIYFKTSQRPHKETTLGERGLLVIEGWFQQFHAYITEIDVAQINKKRLLVYTILNGIGVLIVIVVMLSISLTPIIIFTLVSMYSFIIYLVLYRKQKKMTNDYKVLGHVIERLSHGEFAQDENEELGVFNPLKENIEHLQNDFQEAVQQEVHSQKMKTELITNVSHDLKTPLTSIISYIDLLNDEKLDEDTRKKYINILDASSDRLKHLIENLFDISKANSGNVNLEYMDVDIIALLKQVEMECEAQFQKKKLSIRNQFYEEKAILKLDSQKTYRIFENLLSNVGKYALPKTRVYVRVEDFGNMVEISIKNVSAGELDFDPEEIMERFTRGDKSRNSEGSGLGLAIAKSFTELLDGTMKISIDGDLFKVMIRFYKFDEES